MIESAIDRAVSGETAGKSCSSSSRNRTAAWTAPSFERMPSAASIAAVFGRVVGALTDVALVVAAEEVLLGVMGAGFDLPWRSCHAPVVATIPVRVSAAMVVRRMSGAGGGKELVDDRDRNTRNECADDAAEDPVLA